MPQDGAGRVFKLLPEPFHGEHVQASNCVSQSKTGLEFCLPAILINAAL